MVWRARSQEREHLLNLQEVAWPYEHTNIEHTNISKGQVSKAVYSHPCTNSSGIAFATSLFLCT